MRNEPAPLSTSFLALSIFALAFPAGAASAETIPLTWWSSRTTAVNVVQPLPEQVRLGSARSGYIEGVITLPGDGLWQLAFTINPDSSQLADRNDYVDIFFNGEFSARYMNGPGTTIYPASAVVSGDSIAYRFEFSSSNSDHLLHIIVIHGNATAIELDCNGNGHPDDQDIAAGTSQDCNTNGTPDECEVSLGHDCCDVEEVGRATGRRDELLDDAGALAGQRTRQGCSDSGIAACVCAIDPYCCNIEWDSTCVSLVESAGCGVCSVEGDCNANDVPDDCDIASHFSEDCNSDLIPDECNTDSDGDDVPDECDNCVSQPNPSQADFDSDGTGDRCDLDIDGDGVPNDVDVCDFTPPGVVVQPNGSLRSDFDEDCDVDLVDFAAFQAEFTGPNSARRE